MQSYAQNRPDFSGFSSKELALLEVQQQRLDAMISQDSATLQAFLSDELIYIHSNALVENKAEHLRTIVSQKIEYQRFNYDEKPTIRIEKNIGILTSVLHVEGLMNKKPFDTHLFFTAIYQKTKKGWQLLRWQSTKKM